ncbi:MAG: hypothetical protein C0469_00510 [Cyanobacteria bacterium DS2.3.42]|nr:hypothetical protein [Cyanobacteria bacterium DS2.3.42]
MTGALSLLRQCRAGLVALAILLFVFGGSTAVLARDTPEGPDTPVSSDASAPVVSAEDPRASDGPAAAGNMAPSTGTAAEIGSQVKKNVVSHEQEEKDRMFVDATFIAVAIILCVIAFFLFMSLPKQPKKASSDNQ